MKEITKKVGSGTFFILAMCIPFIVFVGLMAICGTSTDVTSLWVFGPNATFTCEWVNPLGTQAIFKSESGSLRFVDLSLGKTRGEIGRRYRIGRTQMKFAQRTFLVPV